MSQPEQESFEQDQESAAAAAEAAGDPGVLPAGDLGDVLDGLAAGQKLQQELAAAQDRELRAHAELENVRKRLYRQMDEERKYAALPLACDLLAVVDNLERAIQAAEKSGNGEGLLAGVRMVNQQLQRVLEQHHCTRIGAQGQPFDPGLHQAIGFQPSHRHPAGTVAEEAQTGYQLHDRVIRPSLVLVSAGPPAAETPAADHANTPST